MKRLKIILQLFVVLIMAIVFFACSLTSEHTQHDKFFKPVSQVSPQKADSGIPVVTQERYATRADGNSKDPLLEMFRQQNKRLDEVIQQLKLLTKNENADNARNADNLSDLLATHDRISNEMMLEMIKEQNQRLNDVVEQLKLLSQNQSAHHSNLTPRVDVAPVRQVPVRRVPVSKHLIASLNYGTAIQLYQNRQYEKAIDAFKQLLNRRIESKLADRYHFWMGVSYFNLNRVNQAISEFNEVLGYDNSEKAESAYFMIGQCYERIGAKKYAKMAFEKMLQIYPQGNLKQVTEKKLALLK